MSDISVSELSFYYPKSSKAALHNVSFAVQAGQCLGLIGPNGSGKSTLLSILAGLLNPTTGHFAFLPSSQSAVTQFIRQHVALVPQEYAFYAQLSVLQNLQYFASLCKLRSDEQAQRLSEVLQQCELQNVPTQRAGTLSGGYKRRLNLAIALLKKPDILYMDEPTVGVDPLSRTTIISLLKTLKAEGKTLIYTSHLLTEVQEICDQIILLNQGKSTQLALHERQKILSIDCPPAAIPNWQHGLSALACQFSIEDNRIDVVIEHYQQFLSLLALVQQSPLAINSLHYDSTSLTQHYLHSVAQDD